MNFPIWCESLIQFLQNFATEANLGSASARHISPLSVHQYHLTDPRVIKIWNFSYKFSS